MSKEFRYEWHEEAKAATNIKRRTKPGQARAVSTAKSVRKGHSSAKGASILSISTSGPFMPTSHLGVAVDLAWLFRAGTRIRAGRTTIMDAVKKLAMALVNVADDPGLANPRVKIEKILVSGKGVAVVHHLPGREEVFEWDCWPKPERKAWPALRLLPPVGDSKSLRSRRHPSNT